MTKVVTILGLFLVFAGGFFGVKNGLAQSNLGLTNDNDIVETELFEGGALKRVAPRGGTLMESTPQIERSDPGLPRAQTEEMPEIVQLQRPYGSQLFSNINIMDKTLGVSPSYEITVGDRIAVRMWGARQYENILTVDVQGNIFLPEIGPIHVSGIKNSTLTNVVKSSVSNVFTSNVKVYTNLLGTQPIGVYVTGAVKYPGRYPGGKADTVLYFLARAGGIDEKSGSYRSIKVLRGGKQLENIDLYSFLIQGEMPIIGFQENDTIVVGPQYPTVTVVGNVRNSYRYEFDPSTYTAGDILSIAGPEDLVSHAMVTGVRGQKTVSLYLPLNEYRSHKVYPGDVIELQNDQTSTQIIVSVEGNSAGPSTMSLDKSSVLGQVIKLIQADASTHDLESVYIRRKSVAERQKLAIEQSLYELQRSVLTGSSASASGSAIRVQEAQLIDRFVQQARAVEPEGRVVLSGADWTDMHLEDGDQIVIPEKSEVIYVSGEVKVPQTVLWRSNFASDDYIQTAGGVSNRGDEDRLIIVRRDGSVQNGNEPIMKGDHIMVLPEIDTKLFAAFKDLIEITYRVALSAAVVLNAND